MKELCIPFILNLHVEFVHLLEQFQPILHLNYILI